MNLKNGAPVEHIEVGFLTSPEYLGHINMDFVQALFLNTLGRTGDIYELASWNNQLQGLGIQGVALSFTESNEHRVRAVTAYFRDFLHRAAR